MKFLHTSGILLSLYALPMSAHAVAYSTDFNSATGPNFAPQDGWVINDSTTEVSFVVAVPGKGNTIALGGFQSAPATKTVNLTHSVNQLAAGSIFSVEYALINSGPSVPFPFLPADDWFGFTLGDGADVLSISFRPTVNENIRQVFHGTTGVSPNGIMTSDYSSPAFSTLSLSFTASGADLLYTGVTGGGGVTFNGVLAGKAGTTWTSVGIDFDIQGATPGDAGSNVIFVDNLSLAPIPEPTALVMGLISMGFLGMRRRRR